MCNQALRDKLFHALRGDALPGLKELDELVLADIDKIMPIVAEYLDKAWLEWTAIHWRKQGEGIGLDKNAN